MTNWQRYVTSEPPFSIDFPDDWKLITDGNAFSLKAPVDVSITLTRFSSPDGDLGLGALKPIHDEFARDRAVRVAVHKISSTEWSGVEAEFAPSPTEVPDSHWLFRCVCHGNRAYVLTVTGPRDLVEQHRATATEIMNTLRLRPL